MKSVAIGALLLAQLGMTTGAFAWEHEAEAGSETSTEAGDRNTLPDQRDYSRNVVTLQYLASGGDYEAGIGFGFYHYKPERIGYFVNAQFGFKQGEPYYDDLSIYSFGDPVRARYKDPIVVNVGVTKSFGTMGLFAGLGYGGAVGVGRKHDPLHILADDGEYFVPDPENDESGINFTAGGTVDFDRLSMDIGYNSSTTSFYIGVGTNF